MPAVSSFRVWATPAEGGRAVWRRFDAWVRKPGGGGRWKWVRPAIWTVGAASTLLAVDVLLDDAQSGQYPGPANLPQASVVFDTTDKIAFTIFKERRIVGAAEPRCRRTSSTQCWPSKTSASTDHYGLDPWRIGGAFFANMRERRTGAAGWIDDHAATRAQEFPDRRASRSDAQVAGGLSWLCGSNGGSPRTRFSELYLNKVYFGNGYYGIEAAARGYFNKTAVVAVDRRSARCLPASSRRRRC